jgi:Poly(R)-hydroxyalkanoic acid synthase subunit (PHA_synth_III_E)
MGQPQSEGDIASLYQALAAEVLEVLRKALAAGADRKDVEAAAWKAYDAWVRAAHASIEKIVATPAIGDVAAALLNSFLRLQQIGNSVVGSLFAPLWPLVGLTPLTETQALFDRIESLRREVRQRTGPGRLEHIASMEKPRASAPKSRNTSRRAQNGHPSGDKKPASITQ